MRRGAAVLGMLAIASCTNESSADPDRCDVASLIPGLTNVSSAPHDDVLAEVLALECGDGIAAPPALYASLARDIAAIVAIDPRMRLAGDADVYPFHSNLAPPASYSAWDDKADAARALLAPSCPQRVMLALGGEAVERTSGLGTPHVDVAFPGRLSDRVVLGLFDRLGVALQGDVLVGDGSRVSFRDTAEAREFWFQLRGGDCPSGCNSRSYAWWRVADGNAILLGEWGEAIQTPEPAQWDYLGFECRKCPDGRATRVVLESACGDGLDDDCDDTIDCDDPDCVTATVCLAEVCDNGVDDNADGASDCADVDCEASLACGAEVACKADADRAFLASYAARGLVVALDRNANGCGSDDVEACLLDTFALNAVSAQCGACLAAAGVCIAERCPVVGFSDEQHDACVEAECGDAARACVP